MGGGRLMGVGEVRMRGAEEEALSSSEVEGPGGEGARRKGIDVVGGRQSGCGIARCLGGGLGEWVRGVEEGVERSSEGEMSYLRVSGEISYLCDIYATLVMLATRCA